MTTTLHGDPGIDRPFSAAARCVEQTGVRRNANTDAGRGETNPG
jgi:GTPase SAR1 family protein